MASAWAKLPFRPESMGVERDLVRLWAYRCPAGTQSAQLCAFGTQSRQVSCNRRRVSASNCECHHPVPDLVTAVACAPSHSTMQAPWPPGFREQGSMYLTLCIPRTCVCVCMQDSRAERDGQSSVCHREGGNSRGYINTLTPRCLPHYPHLPLSNFLGSSTICLRLDKGQASPTLSVTVASPALT